MNNSLATRLSKEAAEAYEDAADNLRSTSQRISTDAGEALSSTAVSLAHAAENLAEGARAQSKAISKFVRHQAREHPIALAGLAAAAVVALLGVTACAMRAR